MIVVPIERPLAQGIDRMSVVSGKENFDRIYNCKDPRPYFTTLRALDYRIHRHAIPIFARCAKLLSVHRNLRRIKMVDLCSGYGVNAALLRFRVTLDDLYTLGKPLRVCQYNFFRVLCLEIISVETFGSPC